MTRVCDGRKHAPDTGSVGPLFKNFPQMRDFEPVLIRLQNVIRPHSVYRDEENGVPAFSGVSGDIQSRREKGEEKRKASRHAVRFTVVCCPL